MFNNFKDNRTYALAWLLTAVALAFAIAVNVHVRNLGVAVPDKSGNLPSVESGK